MATPGAPDELIPPGTAVAVPVWDLGVRLFHWSLVVCVALNSLVLEEGKDAHQWVGYAAFGLVLARVLWGFVGSRHARFAAFFPTPSRVWRPLSALRRGHVQAYVGHSPLGAVMMLTLMALVLALGVTGWMQGLDAYFGEEWLQELHEALATLLWICVGLHVLAALLLGRLERVGLVWAMVTGVKRSR